MLKQVCFILLKDNAVCLHKWTCTYHVSDVDVINGKYQTMHRKYIRKKCHKMLTVSLVFSNF